MTETKGSTRASGRGAAENKPAEFVPPGVLRSFFRAPGVFYRQSVAELRKVTWPVRKEVVTYTSVVLVFVLILIGIVTGLDVAIGKGVLAIFG
ncbi:MAG: preprotein translocase subunit SecE [Nocardioidaceae bacterium]